MFCTVFLTLSIENQYSTCMLSTSKCIDDVLNRFTKLEILTENKVGFKIAHRDINITTSTGEIIINVVLRSM